VRLSLLIDQKRGYQLDQNKYAFNMDHRYQILKYLSQKIKFELDPSFGSTIEIEKPIFTANVSRRLIIDGIIDLYSTKHCEVGPRVIKSFNNKELKITYGSCYRKILYDAKPQLNSISGILAQMHTYNYHMKYCRWTDGIKSNRLSSPDLIVLTLDGNTGFDDILVDQGVNILHVNPKDIK
jgi:hypothetical protein